MKATSSGLAIRHIYLDAETLTFWRVTLKVFVCGTRMTGFRFKHVEMGLEEKDEVREGTKSLASMLPFARLVELREGPIEFGHDFNQHFTYDYNDGYGYVYRYSCRRVPEIGWENRRKMGNGELIMKEGDDDELTTEHCGSSNTTTLLLTRAPKSTSRWSLLKELRLKKSEAIGKEKGRSINGGDSILTSLAIALFHDDEHWRSIKPQLDLEVSFLDIPPSSSRDNGFRIFYHTREVASDFPIIFRCGFTDDSNYDSLLLEWLDMGSPPGWPPLRIRRKEEG